MQNSRTTAGETAKSQTKPAWGIVAIIGVMVAATMGDSLILAAIGTAMVAIGGWLGGYMDGDARLTDAGRETGAQAGERRAA